MVDEPFGYPVDDGVCEVWVCPGCGFGFVPVRLFGGRPAGCLGVALRGGYGAFFDDAVVSFNVQSVLELLAERTVWLCHDCGVELLSAWSCLAGLLGVGEHASVVGGACCGWGVDRVGELLADQAERERAEEWLDYALSMIDEEGAAKGAIAWSASSVAMPPIEEVLRRERERVRKLVDEDTSGG